MDKSWITCQLCGQLYKYFVDNVKKSVESIDKWVMIVNIHVDKVGICFGEKSFLKAFFHRIAETVRDGFFHLKRRSRPSVICLYAGVPKRDSHNFDEEIWAHDWGQKLPVTPKSLQESALNKRLNNGQSGIWKVLTRKWRKMFFGMSLSTRFRDKWPFFVGVWLKRRLFEDKMVSFLGDFF